MMATPEVEKILDRAVGEAVRMGNEGDEMVLTWVVGVSYRIPEDYVNGTTRYRYYSPDSDGAHTVVGLLTMALDFYRGRD